MPRKKNTSSEVLNFGREQLDTLGCEGGVQSVVVELRNGKKARIFFTPVTHQEVEDADNELEARVAARAAGEEVEEPSVVVTNRELFAKHLCNPDGTLAYKDADDAKSLPIELQTVLPQVLMGRQLGGGIPLPKGS